MEKEFVPYELAVKLKELGFDEPCLARHLVVTEWEKQTGEKRLQLFLDASIEDKFLIKAPLWQQAFNWFTRKGLHSYIEGAYPWFRYYINTEDDRYEGFKHLKIEEARLACLEKLIEICKNH